MLSEKEMAEIIVSHVRMEHTNVYVHAGDAAHAIFERLAEGIVLSMEGAWSPPDSMHKGILWVAANESNVHVVSCLPLMMDGLERVSVTVTKTDLTTP